MRRDGAEGIRLLLEGKGGERGGACVALSELVVTVRVFVSHCLAWISVCTCTVQHCPQYTSCKHQELALTSALPHRLGPGHMTCRWILFDSELLARAVQTHCFHTAEIIQTCVGAVWHS